MGWEVLLWQRRLCPLIQQLIQHVSMCVRMHVCVYAAREKRQRSSCSAACRELYFTNPPQGSVFNYVPFLLSFLFILHPSPFSVPRRVLCVFVSPRLDHSSSPSLYFPSSSPLAAALRPPRPIPHSCNPHRPNGPPVRTQDGQPCVYYVHVCGSCVRCNMDSA